MKRGSRNAAICLKLTSKMLKDAIRFHYSWQPNLLTADMIPSWQLCKTCYDIVQKIEKIVGNEMSMNHRKILQQPIIQLAILIQMKQKKQPRERLNRSRGLQSIGDTSIKIYSIPKNRRVSYVNEKVQRVSALCQTIVCSCCWYGRK